MLVDIMEKLLKCFEQLNKILTEKEMCDFKNTPEDKMIDIYHHGLGRHIRNTFGLNVTGYVPDIKKFTTITPLHHSYVQWCNGGVGCLSIYPTS